jgi:hypothetical protein
MTLDASGNLGIGSTSPETKFQVSGNAYIGVSTTGGVGAQTGLTVVGGATVSSTDPGIITISSHSNARTAGDDIGRLNFYSNDASGGASGIQASVRAVTSGSVGEFGNLTFFTGSAASLAERARIDSSGNLLVGTTSAFSGSGISPKVTISNSAGIGLIGIGNSDSGMVTQPAANTNYYAGFFLNSSSTGVGNIFCTGSGTTYNTTSDQRLKENIQDADSASSLIDSLQVRKFDWKTDQTHQRYGFIAQELVTVAPEAVHQPTDTEQMMAVDYSKLVPMLVKEIQSLRQRLSAANL